MSASINGYWKCCHSGWCWGVLSLAVLSLLRFLEHRNSIDGLAALFGLCVTVTVAQINGVMNLFVSAFDPRHWQSCQQHAARDCGGLYLVVPAPDVQPCRSIFIGTTA